MSNRRSKLEPWAHLVGVLPDREVAERAGVTPENVRTWRRRRGIPARWRGESRPALDFGGRDAFVVTAERDGERRSFVVFGVDAPSAATEAAVRLADAWPGARAVGLARAGEEL